MEKIPLSVPNLNIDILENIRECIETGWVSTGGRFISEFEEKVAAYAGAPGAVSTQSGTVGLQIALRVLGIREGQEVLVPALTFIGAVNPVKYIGAEPVFMDCDESFCLDPDKLSRFCENNCEKTEDGLINRATGRKVSAIMVVHVFGNMADMELIMSISEKYNLKVIEDATEAVGTYYTDGIYEGRFSATIGHAGVYSFNANKIITTGGGGMILSNDKKLLDYARYLSTTAKDDPLYFIHDEIGYNYRMLNIQAAFGTSQIDELESFIEIKKKNYELYKELLAEEDGITLLPFRAGTRPNHWFYPFYIDKQKFGLDRDELLFKLNNAGIECRPVWKLVNEQKPYISSLCFEIQKARDYASNILNLPCSVGLTEDEIKYVCDIIRSK